MPEYAATSLTVVKANECKVISCSNCNKPLVRSTQRKIEKELLYRVIIQCPYCGDNSWEEKIYGVWDRVAYSTEIKFKDIETLENGKLIKFPTEQIKAKS